MGKGTIIKSITESIIGRKSTLKALRSFDDLRYGDVVGIYDEGNIDMHIYLPLKQLKDIRSSYGLSNGLSMEADGFVRYDPNTRGHLSYWDASVFRQTFPESKIWGELVKITKYITHINEWQSISDGDDIKKLFSKYNIPINETH